MLNTVTAQNRSTLGKNLNNYLPVYSGDVNPIIEKVNELSNKSYKVYTALLTQNFATAPVAIVLENTLGDIVFTYDNDGQYYGELIDGFVDGKTFILVSNDVKSVEIGNFGIIQYLDTNTLIINSYNGSGVLSNGVFNNTPIEIRVYN